MTGTTPSVAADQTGSLLTAEQLQQLQQFKSTLSPLQLAWSSGYLAALAESSAGSTAASATSLTPTPASMPAPTLTVLYGSQTGNSRELATQFAEAAKAQGLTVKLLSMAEFKPKQIKDVEQLVIVVSTHGEGEAPDDAIELHQYLGSKRAPQLPTLNYSVLALGDSSYEFYCQTGKDFDQRLAALGAQAIVPRQDCDVDYEEDAASWQQATLTAFAALHQQLSSSAEPQADLQKIVSNSAAGTTSSTQAFSKNHPFTAEVIVSQKITGRDSTKNIRHVEIDLLDSGLSYQVGDALGVWFDNDPALVNTIIQQMNLDPEQTVTIKAVDYSLFDALTRQKELTQLTPKVIQAWAQWSQAADLISVLEDSASVRQYVLNHQVVDLVEQYPVQVSAQALIDALRPLTPRLYSIASAQEEVESEVHLTVALVEDNNGDTPRYGGASHFLTRAEEGAAIQVYVEPNAHFRLPENPQTPVIMVGPGTGIAPFRAFMQARDAQGATGRNWLFFGNPHFEQDFLYQTEWQQYLKSGLLTRLDVAFSRDQAEKIYVQDKLKLQAAAVWQWLENGAHFYICGDANRMAKDVHQALIDIVISQGQRTVAQAEEYLEQLRVSKRYQKDVY